MKISTRLRLTIAILVLIVASTAIALAYSWHTVRSSIVEAKAASLAVQHILELNQLTAEYEFRPEARPAEQWRKVFQSLDNAIDALARSQRSEAHVALHDKLRHSSRNVNDLFERWVVSRGNALGKDSSEKPSRLHADSIMLNLRSMESAAQRIMRQADDDALRRHSVRANQIRGLNGKRI